MIRRLLRRHGRQAALLGLAVVLLASVPGVAIASLPAPPAPTHGCCAAAAAPMTADACGTAPCCVEKPAPRTFSVLTGDAAPMALPAVLDVGEAPVVVASAAPASAPAPRARSAPLFVLLVTFLN